MGEWSIKSSTIIPFPPTKHQWGKNRGAGFAIYFHHLSTYWPVFIWSLYLWTNQKRTSMALTINGHVVSMGGKIWETRESADSPPCNCRQFFFWSRWTWNAENSENHVFFTCFILFHLLEAFAKHHFLLRRPIQNSKNVVSLRRNGHFFYHVGKKWKCSFDVRIPIPKDHTS